MILPVVFLLGVAQPPRPLAGRRRRLDAELRNRCRILPDGLDPASDLASAAGLARALKLEVTPPGPR